MVSLAAMADEFVTIQRDGDIATLTLDRPDRRNALSAGAARAVAQGVAEAAAGARAIIVTGAGAAFCAGGDLEELERWSELSPEEVASELYDGFQNMIRAVRSSSAVVIAAINGAAVGAGLDLALACDLRIAASGAKLGQVWVGLGVIPGTGGAWLTQALAGPAKAAELLLTGEVIIAEEALDAGLLNAVVGPDALLDEATAWARRILKHPKDGVVANKRAMVAATETELEAALAHAAQVQPARFTSEEFRLALRSRRS